MLKPKGALLVVLADGLYDFDPGTEKLSLRVKSPLPDYVKLHECQTDRQGRLWVGAYDHHFSPSNRDAKGGSIFRLDGDQLTPVINNISVANAMAFSPDGKTLYISDSPTRRVDTYDLDPDTGNLSNPKQFLQLHDGEGFVDGATVDAEGGFWLAAVGAGTLRRYLANGQLDRVVELPVCNPTKPAFGGPQMSTLFVTTTRLPIGKNSEANGGLYALDMDTCGVQESEFKG